MYPDFQYLLQSLLGIDIPEWVGTFKTFGFFVAIGFLLGGVLMVREMKRKEQEGLLQPEIVEREDKATGVKKKVAILPHQRVTDMLVLAAITGLIGAKVFNALETWESFLRDPIDNLFSRSGLTFYGGLITATAALYIYCRKHKISFVHLADATAPALMLAYGVGRLGCHFSGDGDWGIFNSAYVSQPNGVLKLAAPGEYEGMLHTAAPYFTNNFGSLAEVPHLPVVAPSWLPDWSVAMNYAHNVNNEGMQIADCVGNYCAMLPVGVFPTSLWEALTCFLLAALLLSLRNVLKKPLAIFDAYLMLNGIERFTIEKIRVNYKYDWGFIHPTQAEIISAVLFLIGLSLLLFYKHKKQLINKS
jgi:phosphatidylglycerol:prolipoprotein diacylglycerol transferase